MRSENNKQRLIKYSIFSIPILMLIIIIIIVFSQNDGIQKERTIITNLPKNIPAQLQKIIGATLYNTLKLNITDNKKTPESGAIMRDNSLEEGYNDETQVYYGDFITDIEDMKLSFNVHYEWSDESDNTFVSSTPVTILCVDKEHKIYDTLCTDMYHRPNSVIDNFANGLLPYTAKTPSGIDYNIIVEYLDGEPFISVPSYTCYGSKEAEEVKNSATEWILSQSSEINLDEIIYRNYCDGIMSEFL